MYLNLNFKIQKRMEIGDSEARKRAKRPKCCRSRQNPEKHAPFEDCREKGILKQ